jgi:regulator of sigma E protease
VSWVLAFLGFAALIILHEAGHFAAAKWVGMRVERFSLFFPPLLVRRKVGETEYAIGATPLGGYVKITGMNPHEELAPDVAHRAYYRQPVWKRIVVIGAGPAVNIALAFLILWVLFMATDRVAPTPVVQSVSKGMPAATFLKPGDRLVAVDGQGGKPEDFQKAISSHKCKGGKEDNGCAAELPAQITFVRNGQERTVSVKPHYEAAIDRPILGFSFGDRPLPREGPVGAAGDSVHEMWLFTSATVSTIAQLFKAEKRKDVSGVVGSYEGVRKRIEVSATRALYLLAVISLSLGVINLFPFLPLDGGHIFWAVAEKVRGRAIPFAVMERAGFVGFALVLVLFMIGFTNDLGRLGEGFGGR